MAYPPWKNLTQSGIAYQVQGPRPQSTKISRGSRDMSLTWSNCVSSECESAYVSGHR